MKEYIPQYLPQPLKFFERMREELARAAERTAESAWMYRKAPDPQRPCKRCKGLGCYTLAKNGKRRRFDHRDFKPTDKYIGSCTKCRGFGYLPISVEELRAAYKKLRKIVCEERGFDEKFFDRKVTKQVVEPELPMAWYQAALYLAKCYGVESTGF